MTGWLIPNNFVRGVENTGADDGMVQVAKDGFETSRRMGASLVKHRCTPAWAEFELATIFI